MISKTSSPVWTIGDAPVPVLGLTGVIPRMAPASRHGVPGSLGRECAAGAAVTCEPAGRRGSGRCGGRGEPDHGQCRRAVRLRGPPRPAPAGAAAACGRTSASHEVNTAYPMMPSAVHRPETARTNNQAAQSEGPGPPGSTGSRRMTAPMAAAVMIRQMPDLAAALASGRRRAGAGGRVGRGCGRGGRDVGGERGQVGVGPRGERLARSRVEFVLGQPTVHERVLQRVDYLLAVGVARPELVAARRGPGPAVLFVTGTSPARTMQAKRSAAAPRRPRVARVLARRAA